MVAVSVLDAGVGLCTLDHDKAVGEGRDHHLLPLAHGVGGELGELPAASQSQLHTVQGHGPGVQRSMMVANSLCTVAI